MATLTSADYEAAVLAIWAHPQGVSYLEKIARMELRLPAWLEAHRGSVGAGADDGISPSYDAYVKRINEQRAAEWQQGISGRRVETSGHGQIASARADRLLSEIAVPSARVAALSGRVERATRPPIHPATIHDDEMLAMLAMVLVLTDD